MRVAYLADRTSPNGFYRAVGPMTDLAHRGHAVRQLPEKSKSFAASVVEEIDVLFVHRYVDSRAVQLMRAAKARGVAVVWDNDDDLGSLEKDTSAYRRFGGMEWQRQLAGMKAVLAMADLVTVPSSVMAQRLEGYGAERTLVLENRIHGLFLMPQDRRTGMDVTIGWVAGWEHQLEVERLPLLT